MLRRRLEWGLGSDDGLFSCTGTIVHDVDGKSLLSNVCAAPSDWDFEGLRPDARRGAVSTPRYHTGFCANKVDIDLIYNISNVTAHHNISSTALPLCDRENDPLELDFHLILVLIAVLYMFYGLAHVCEDFLVPALIILCERFNIPEDVAGATLLAAGCNAPEMFTSIVGVFIDHSTVGAGTVIGSAPFNLLCIPGGAALVVGGRLALKPWLMVREIFFLIIALGTFQGVMFDFVVNWWEALILVVIYALYCLVCVHYGAILRMLMACGESIRKRRQAVQRASVRGVRSIDASIESYTRGRADPLMRQISVEVVGGESSATPVRGATPMVEPVTPIPAVKPSPMSPPHQLPDDDDVPPHEMPPPHTPSLHKPVAAKEKASTRIVAAAAAEEDDDANGWYELNPAALAAQKQQQGANGGSSSPLSPTMRSPSDSPPGGNLARASSTIMAAAARIPSRSRGNRLVGRRSVECIKSRSPLRPFKPRESRLE